MAYMNQERKQALAPKIKAILKQYGLKGTLAVHNYSTLVLNITEGAIDFLGNQRETALANNPTGDYRREQPAQQDYLQVNPYWFHEHFTGQARNALRELVAAMNVGNHDNSEPQFDHFDVGWYIDVNIGKWNKPYKVVA